MPTCQNHVSVRFHEYNLPFYVPVFKYMLYFGGKIQTEGRLVQLGRKTVSPIVKKLICWSVGLQGYAYS